MSIEQELHNRSESKCELCQATEHLKIYEVPPVATAEADSCVLVCDVCLSQLENPEQADPNHWRCLNESMWSEHSAVQVVAWRMLSHLRAEGWTQDLLDMLYLEEEVLAWAKATEQDEDAVIHKDSNGVVLQSGDNVVLIKDLPVKGSSMVAKRGTAVRRISLDHENAEYIEGKVDGQQIVILTKYVKKT